MKPTRQTAIGKVCAKHPELLGQRYIPNRTCVACSKARSKENYAARELTVMQEIAVLRGEINRLKAENEALRKDAERYRYLRDDLSTGSFFDFCIIKKSWSNKNLERILSLQDADDEIDFAMSCETQR